MSTPPPAGQLAHTADVRPLVEGHPTKLRSVGRRTTTTVPDARSRGLPERDAGWRPRSTWGCSPSDPRRGVVRTRSLHRGSRSSNDWPNEVGDTGADSIRGRWHRPYPRRLDRPCRHIAPERSNTKHARQDNWQVSHHRDMTVSEPPVAKVQRFCDKPTRTRRLSHHRGTTVSAPPCQHPEILRQAHSPAYPQDEVRFEFATSGNPSPSATDFGPFRRALPMSGVPAPRSSATSPSPRFGAFTGPLEGPMAPPGGAWKSPRPSTRWLTLRRTSDWLHPEHLDCSSWNIGAGVLASRP